jgi:ketosteroid isomerase-like protein
MGGVRSEIEEIVDRETRAWDTGDVDLLLTVFHPDMVWPWPRTVRSHDPMDWVLEWGRYDPERWGRGWQELFDTHELVRNEREIRKIEVSEEGDGAFAMVDIATQRVTIGAGRVGCARCTRRSAVSGRSPCTRGCSSTGRSRERCPGEVV